MRKILFVLILLGVLFTVALYQALNNPWLSEKLVRRVFEKSTSDIQLIDIRIAEQKYYWPAHFEFSEVTLSFSIKGKPLALKCSRLELDISQVSREIKKFALWFDSATARFDLGEAQNVRAELKVAISAQGGVTLEGPVTAQLLTWDRAKAERVSAEALADSRGVYFPALKGEAFGGAFTGSADVFFSNPFAYSLRLSLKDLDTEELASVAPQVVEQVNGRLSGEVGFDGAGDRLTNLEADLAMPAGGRVNALLLATLTQYLPDTREKRRLDALIKVGGKLAVESFIFTIRNDTPGHLSGEIRLTSKEANLNLNLTHDIYVDGSWEDILQSWQAVFK